MPVHSRLGGYALQIMAGAPDMADIMTAVGLVQSGETEAGRAALLSLWPRVEAAGTPQEKCTVAHFLADTEMAVEAELEWDLRALAAATGSREASAMPPLGPELASFLPSLHLNVGDAYRRLGDAAQAAAHAAAGLECCTSLPDDGYGALIRGGLERLQSRLEEDGH